MDGLDSNFLFVAAHMGPYLSISPLEKSLCEGRSGLFLLDAPARNERSRGNLPFIDSATIRAHPDALAEFLNSHSISSIIRSSSENLNHNIEDLVSIAAKTIGLPVFVIEDFPGNFKADQNYSIDALFIEDSSLVELHSSRGIDPSKIFVARNPRYEQFTAIDRLHSRIQMRDKFGLADEAVILWAGQPDDGNSYKTLKRLLDNFKNNEVTLLFKAHPRDTSYSTVECKKLFENCPMNILDGTAESDNIGLYCAADLVVTQFSSAGVEASHLGTPSMFVMFDDLGKAYMQRQKGHTHLPWSQNNCSYLIENELDIPNVLEKALFDQDSRRETISNFRINFGQETGSAQSITNTIRKISSGAHKGRDDTTTLEHSNV